MMLKRMLRCSECHKVDRNAMGLGGEERTETEQAAVGRGRSRGNCDRQNFRSFRQWCDVTEVEDFGIGALKNETVCGVQDGRRNHNQLCARPSRLARRRCVALG